MNGAFLIIKIYMNSKAILFPEKRCLPAQLFPKKYHLSADKSIKMLKVLSINQNISIINYFCEFRLFYVILIKYV